MVLYGLTFLSTGVFIHELKGMASVIFILDQSLPCLLKTWAFTGVPYWIKKNRGERAQVETAANLNFLRIILQRVTEVQFNFTH
jgi:hypothetical protein